MCVYTCNVDLLIKAMNQCADIYTCISSISSGPSFCLQNDFSTFHWSISIKHIKVETKKLTSTEYKSQRGYFACHFDAAHLNLRSTQYENKVTLFLRVLEMSSFLIKIDNIIFRLMSYFIPVPKIKIQHSKFDHCLASNDDGALKRVNLLTK